MLILHSHEARQKNIDDTHVALFDMYVDPHASPAFVAVKLGKEG
jgi:hypothetical protein